MGKAKADGQARIHVKHLKADATTIPQNALRLNTLIGQIGDLARNCQSLA